MLQYDVGLLLFIKRWIWLPNKETSQLVKLNNRNIILIRNIQKKLNKYKERKKTPRNIGKLGDFSLPCSCKKGLDLITYVLRYNEVVELLKCSCDIHWTQTVFILIWSRNNHIIFTQPLRSGRIWHKVNF